MRPLLRLAQIITGAEWAFVTSIDHERRRNRMLSLPPLDPSTNDDDLCFPLVVGDAILGEMRCAGSATRVLDADQREGVQLIAVAMQRLLEFAQDKSQAQASAAAAGLDAEVAQVASRRMGIARYSLDADGCKCECTVIESDRWPDPRLGLALMRRLIGLARERGIQSLYSVDDVADSGTRTMAEALGFQSRPDPLAPDFCIRRLELRPAESIVA